MVLLCRYLNLGVIEYDLYDRNFFEIDEIAVVLLFRYLALIKSQFITRVPSQGKRLLLQAQHDRPLRYQHARQA